MSERLLHFIFLFIGNTEKALKILMNVNCPSVDERDERGFCHFVCINQSVNQSINQS